MMPHHKSVLVLGNLAADQQLFESVDLTKVDLKKLRQRRFRQVPEASHLAPHSW